MPEGPEVRRYADLLAATLDEEPIIDIAARTRLARAWLAEHSIEVIGARIERVRSHGKHLIGYIEGEYFFHSHLMMWGRWFVEPGDTPPPVDRRERARIVTGRGTAVLNSAPVFDIGEGDPYATIEHLATLGPDALPYPEDGPFDTHGFLERLRAPENLERTVGAALLDQRIVAGLGNYLRAEILFVCKIDPWRKVGDLTTVEIACIAQSVPALTDRAYLTGGVTVPDEARDRMRADASLVYQVGREMGTRHWVFRRTNLPCLECGDAIRQMRQPTSLDEEDERTRIIYFCPTCQEPSVELPARRRRVA